MVQQNSWEEKSNTGTKHNGVGDYTVSTSGGPQRTPVTQTKVQGYELKHQLWDVVLEQAHLWEGPFRRQMRLMQNGPEDTVPASAITSVELKPPHWHWAEGPSTSHPTSHSGTVLQLCFFFCF